MVVLKQILIGVVCEDMFDYNRWVSFQSYNTLKRYTPITNAIQAATKCDEIIITTNAQCNSEYYNIYKKLNGAYRLAKREPIYYGC